MASAVRRASPPGASEPPNQPAPRVTIRYKTARRNPPAVTESCCCSLYGTREPATSATAVASIQRRTVGKTASGGRIPSTTKHANAGAAMAEATQKTAIAFGATRSRGRAEFTVPIHSNGAVRPTAYRASMKGSTVDEPASEGTTTAIPGYEDTAQRTTTATGAMRTAIKN